MEDNVSFLINHLMPHAEFLLRGALTKRGVNIREISADPLSVYTTKKRKTTEVGVQSDCPVWTSLENVEGS